MKVAVLGSGNIGGTLGKKWASAGHEVVFGVRDVNSPKARALLKAGIGNLSIDTVGAAIAFGEIVVLAIPGAEVEALVDAQAKALSQKLIVDATNRVSAPVMNSLATIAAKAPQAKLFRAFNSLGWENFAEPQFGALQADLFYCGSDDEHARAAVERLIADIGLRPVRVGDLNQVALVDMVTRLWFALALGQKLGRHLAFKVLTP
jgi:predicted dinucleotide-binding enzyme